MPLKRWIFTFPDGRITSPYYPPLSPLFLVGMMASWDPELPDPDLGRQIPTNFSITISGQEV